MSNDFVKSLSGSLMGFQPLLAIYVPKPIKKIEKIAIFDDFWCFLIIFSTFRDLALPNRSIEVLQTLAEFNSYMYV